MIDQARASLEQCTEIRIPRERIDDSAPEEMYSLYSKEQCLLCVPKLCIKYCVEAPIDFEI